MATVWEGRMIPLDGLAYPVAIKIPHARRMRTDKDFRRFVREALVSLELGVNHPHLVGVYGFGRLAAADDELALIMELVRGASLQQLGAAVRREHAILRAVPRAALDALGTLHGRGFTHCDVSPRNLLLGRDGMVKVADLGLAYRRGSSDTHPLAGVPSYMSPERLQHRDASPAIDLFALGATLYHVVTGRPRYGTTEAEILASLHRTPDLPDDLPADLRTLIEGLVAPDPRDRLTVEQALAVLETGGQPIARPAELAAFVRTWLRQHGDPRDSEDTRPLDVHGAVARALEARSLALLERVQQEDEADRPARAPTPAPAASLAPASRLVPAAGSGLVPAAGPGLPLRETETESSADPPGEDLEDPIEEIVARLDAVHHDLRQLAASLRSPAPVPEARPVSSSSGAQPADPPSGARPADLPSGARPADLPSSPPRPPWSRAHYWIVAGLGGLALAASVVLLVLARQGPSRALSPDRPAHPAPEAVHEITALPPLPMTERAFPTCDVGPAATIKAEIPARPARPAPVATTPRRRKASTLRFVSDMDSVIVKRENKPALRVTVQEVPETAGPGGDRTGPPLETARHYEIALEPPGHDVEIGIGDGDVKLTMERVK